jgi:hypothetical protein
MFHVRGPFSESRSCLLAFHSVEEAHNQSSRRSTQWRKWPNKKSPKRDVTTLTISWEVKEIPEEGHLLHDCFKLEHVDLNEPFGNNTTVLGSRGYPALASLVC